MQSTGRQLANGSGNDGDNNDKAGEETGEHAHGHGRRQDGRRAGRTQRHWEACELSGPSTISGGELVTPVVRASLGRRHGAPQARRIESCAGQRRQFTIHPSSTSTTATMESIRPAFATLRLSVPRKAPRPLYRCLHTTIALRATPLPHPSVPGPPPETPTPAPSDALYRVARKRKQAELLKQAREVRTTSSSKKTLLQKRFWKDVSVKETEGDCSTCTFMSSITDRVQMGTRSSSIADRFGRRPKRCSPCQPPSTSSPRPLPSNGTSS